MENYKNFWQQLLTSDVYSKRFDLFEIFGFSEFAWRYEEVVKIIYILQKEGYVISGGDVYKVTGDDLLMTYDSWYYNGTLGIESVKVTKEYIENYWNKNGENYVYSIVIRRIT